MKYFTDFMAERGLKESISLFEAKAMTSTGPRAEYDKTKYISPFLPGGEKHNKAGTHALRVDLPGAKAGTRVALIKHSVEGGKHHVVVSAAGKRHKIETSKLFKPTEGKLEQNKGVNYEKNFHNILKKEGLVAGDPPGARSDKPDFSLINKRKDTVHHGIHGDVPEEDKTPAQKKEEKYQQEFGGEVKQSKHALYGQAALRWDSEKGWHVGEGTKKKNPTVAAFIEKHHKIAGEPVLEYLNKHHPTGTTAEQRLQLKGDKTNLDHIQAYAKDKNVDILHVGGGQHGTYRVGHSAEKDRTGIGLSPIQGHGHIEVRRKEKYPNYLTLEFRADHIDKAKHDLENAADRKLIRQKLGHES